MSRPLTEILERDRGVHVALPQLDQLPKKVAKVVQATLDAQAAYREAIRDRHAADALVRQSERDAERVAAASAQAGEPFDAASLLQGKRDAVARLEEAALTVSALGDALTAHASRIAPTLEANRESIETQAFADAERAIVLLATARKSVEAAHALLTGSLGVLGMFAHADAAGFVRPIVQHLPGTKSVVLTSELVTHLGEAVGRAQIETDGLRRG